MPDMGRGIIAPANNDNIGTGASEMRALASTAATAIDALDASVDAKVAAAVGRSTGARDIAASLPEISVGQVILARTGNLVQISLQSIRLPEASGNTAFSQFLPIGFRPLAGMLLIVPITQGNTDLRRFRVTGSGQMLVYNYDTNGLLTGSSTFLTDDPWPDALPGVPA